jgi:hypothetical protein
LFAVSGRFSPLSRGNDQPDELRRRSDRDRFRLQILRCWFVLPGRNPQRYPVSGWNIEQRD